jgi:hypothetical protein
MYYLLSLYLFALKKGEWVMLIHWCPSLYLNLLGMLLGTERLGNPELKFYKRSFTTSSLKPYWKLLLPSQFPYTSIVCIMILIVSN